MVRPPSPADEDERRLTRERRTLVTERVRHVNRIKGLLATQGVFGFEPLKIGVSVWRNSGNGMVSRCQRD